MWRFIDSGTKKKKKKYLPKKNSARFNFANEWFEFVLLYRLGPDLYKKKKNRLFAKTRVA